MATPLLVTAFLCIAASGLLNGADAHDVRVEGRVVTMEKRQGCAHRQHPQTDGNCTADMFPGDQWALWACRAQVAMQNNWFPSPISGLFSYQVWNGFDGFWQNGCVLETMANFMTYARHDRYVTTVRRSLREVYELLEAYYPAPSFDDMAWYGLSYLRIYEVLAVKDFLQRALDIFHWNWNQRYNHSSEGMSLTMYFLLPGDDQKGWDHSGNCWGGMWFDQGFNSKVTITNVQMLQLAAKLYNHTGRSNKTLLSQARAIWRFIDRTYLINNATWLVADGIDMASCYRNENYRPTYSSGVLAGGLVHLADVLNNTGFLDLAHNVANATIVLKSNHEGILMEPCDYNRTCGKDHIVFKGIFVRHLRYLADASDNVTAARYRKWMLKNAQSLVVNDSCTGEVTGCKLVFTDGAPFYPPVTPVFDALWPGPFDFSSPIQQASALDLLVSSIAPGTRCRGPRCGYDPPVPTTPPLTCEDSPCPPDQPCCEFDGGYRTCCTPDQKCIKGLCT